MTSVLLWYVKDAFDLMASLVTNHLTYWRVHATGNIPQELLIAPSGLRPSGAINNSFVIFPVAWTRPYIK